MMRRPERLEHLHADLGNAPAGQRSLADERGQGRAVHEFHHDERRAVPLVDVVDRADTGMIQ